MADNIPNIVIEIESNASGAVSQLDQLANSLRSLKKATGNSNVLSTFSKNFETLNRSIRFMNNIDPSKAESIKRMAEAAGSFKGITISKTIGDGITSINTSLNALSEDNMAKLFEFANTMFLLKEMQGFRYPTSINTGLLKTAELAEQIKDADFTKLKELVETITQLGKLSVEDSGAVKQLANSMKVLTTETKQATTHGKKFNTVLANIRTKTMAMYMGLSRLVRGATKAMSVYGDYVEALNLYKMAMGGAAEEGYKFAETAQAILGIDLTKWMQAQGVFMALGKGFGVAEEKAAIMSKNLTQLAYDISSFYNISVEDAIQKVQSGFAGQIRPVRNLGYDLSQARLEAIALANGIDEEVKSMTQAEKSQLRYIALMTQLTEVQGDLARTLDSPTNQLRLLNAQIDQMTRSIGMTLLPLMNKAIPYLNAVFRVIKMIAEEIAAMFGYTLPRITGGDWSTNVSIGADEIEDSLEDANGAAEKLKNTLASFDQINLITSKSGGSGSGSGGSISSSDLGLDLPEYDFLGDATENRAQQIANGMMNELRPFLDNFLKPGIKWVADNIEAISKALFTLATVTIGKNLVTSLLNAFNLADKFSQTVGALGNVVIGLQFSYLGGESMAKGDWLTGIIESTIGAAALAKGLSFFFGKGGIVIGLGVSLLMTLKGFSDQKQKEFIDSCNDIFFALRDGRQSVEDFTKTWKEFIDSYTNPPGEDETTTATKLRDNVKEIQTSVEDMHMSYLTGVITAESYAITMEQLFADLSQAIIDYNDAAAESLRQSLTGEFKVVLLMAGHSMEEVNALIDEAHDNINKSVEDIQANMEELVQKHNEGNLSDTAFSESMNKLYDDLKEYGVELTKSEQATKVFTDAWSTPINFTSWDELIDTFNQVTSDYEYTMGKMKDYHNGLIEEMEFYTKGLSGKEKEQWEDIIRVTKDKMAEQEQELTDGYKRAVQNIENTGYINWLDVYNVEGIDGAIVEYQQGAGKFNDAVNEAFERMLLTREDGAFSYSASVLGMLSADEEFASKSSNLLDKAARFVGFNYRSKDLDALADKTDGTFRKIAVSFGHAEDVTKNWSDSQKKMYNAVMLGMGDTSSAAAEFMKTLYTGGKVLERQTDEAANNIQVHFDRMGNIVAVTSKTMEDDMSYSIAAIGTMIGNDAWTVQPMSANLKDLINVVDTSSGTFGDSFWGLMNKASYILGDPTGMLENSLFSALDMPEHEFVALGYDLGVSIAKGIEDSTPGVSAAAHHWAEGVAREWNIFGNEADEFFKALFDNGAAAINLLGGNSATSSVYNPKKIRIRGYASGGFPKSADFFYANENGVPEYVGSMGGKTAVANNAEITKGVSDGVYKAIKDTGLINDVKRIAGKEGKIVFAPSEEAGKVMSQSVNMYNGVGGRY